MEDHIQVLLEKYRKGTCTPEEMNELDKWYHQLDTEPDSLIPEAVKADWQQYTEARLQELKSKESREARPERKRLWLLRTAAAALLFISIGITAYWLMNVKQNTVILSQVVSDMPPGQNGAILTLADGSKIILDSNTNGQVAVQSGATITGNQNMLAYNSNISGNVPVAYNTLTTPKARQYKLLLPDGTAVWLNAASSITYPTAFTGSERKVTVTGEAYFEVVHNAAQPFKVTVGSHTITDVGTHFDVYAYNDEPEVKTTLLEGAVAVEGKILQPGEQAQLDKNNRLKIVKLKDAENMIAWKDGIISFDVTDIQTLFKQISRWYNVEVVYTGAIPTGHISGEIPRNTNLSDVIKALEISDIHCHLEGNKLMVSP